MYGDHHDVDQSMEVNFAFTREVKMAAACNFVF